MWIVYLYSDLIIEEFWEIYEDVKCMWIEFVVKKIVMHAFNYGLKSAF